VFKRINHLRIKLKESLEDFADRFFHICYKFPERYLDWMYLNEKFQRLVYVSLQHFQSEMNLNSDDHRDNLPVVYKPNLIHNLFFPTFVSQEKYQALEETINSCEIPRPPSNSLPNEFFVIDNRGDEECL